MLVAEPQLDPALRDTPLLPPRAIADMAVAALRAEAQLTPKPGLVDRRGSGVHTDMNLEMLLASADALHEGFAECATAAQDLPLGTALRARVGVIGRTAEHHMLAVTGGINTHRGALWSLGLLAAGVARHRNMNSAIQFAAALAMHPDPGLRATADSHGARARRRYGASGAIGEAQTGFPHVVDHALPTLRRARSRGADETTARLDALLAVIAHLADTCLLHRGGLAGLTAIRRGAARTGRGRQRHTGRSPQAGAARRPCAHPTALARRKWRLALRRTVSRLPSDPSKGIRTTMQTLTYRFPADRHPVRRVHVGVVASGDLEILLDPPSAAARHADVRVRTSVNGFDTVWHDVLARFFARTPISGRWELNDFGATPGVVTLRLGQVAEAARADSEERP